MKSTYTALGASTDLEGGRDLANTVGLLYSHLLVYSQLFLLFVKSVLELIQWPYLLCGKSI